MVLNLLEVIGLLLVELGIWHCYNSYFYYNWCISSNYSYINGNIDGTVIGAASAAAGAFAAIVGTSLSVSDGNITNVGSITCDSVVVDDASAGLDIVFGGNTTTNKISLTDNIADALNINEGGNSYMKFTTTNGSEQIVFGKGSI